MDMLERKPTGGYRTKGSAREGVMVRLEPGGRAMRPSFVSQMNLLRRSWALEGSGAECGRNRQARARPIHSRAVRTSMPGDRQRPL